MSDKTPTPQYITMDLDEPLARYIDLRNPNGELPIIKQGGVDYSPYPSREAWISAMRPHLEALARGESYMTDALVQAGVSMVISDDEDSK